mmetsp:Transcript_18566/g.38638  ORF Transcript_18566/g.38638 Transcript_18566/m.38638 type:complete len:210 (+) Transcript_18566:950-1579(+)
MVLARIEFVHRVEVALILLTGIFIVFIFIVVVIVDFNAFAVGHSFSKVKVRLGRISANHGSTVKRVVRVTILRSFKCIVIPTANTLLVHSTTLTLPIPISFRTAEIDDVLRPQAILFLQHCQHESEGKGAEHHTKTLFLGIWMQAVREETRYKLVLLLTVCHEIRPKRSVRFRKTPLGVVQEAVDNPLLPNWLVGSPHGLKRLHLGHGC